jgi:cell division ATPase FtsA
LQRQTLADVIEPRYTELLNLVNDEILQLQEQLRQQGVKHHLAAGIVLTGGQRKLKVWRHVPSVYSIRKCVLARRSILLV